MATYTSNYNLEKPDYNDSADIGVINNNMDKIDAKMKEIDEKAGSGGGVGSFVVDTLWDEVIASEGTYTLAKSIDDYDFLIASAWAYTSGVTQYEQCVYSFIPKKDYYLRSTVDNDVYWAFCMYSENNRRCVFQFDDDTTLRIAYQTTSKFRALYGVKLGS